MEITFLGVRGAAPTSNKNQLVFGGATSCILIEANNQMLYIDFGTGCFNSIDKFLTPKKAAILFTHYHLDHIQGFLCFRRLLREIMNLMFTARA